MKPTPSLPEYLDLDKLQELIRHALSEDIGPGDVTTNAIVPRNARCRAMIISKQSGVVAGLLVAERVFRELEADIEWDQKISEGQAVEKGQKLVFIQGNTRAILSAERVALNFLQRMSGIATLTREFVKAVEPFGTIILDTRKTAPGLRMLDKWAVKLGGGENHRFGLFDMALVKENHIAIAGGIQEAVRRVRENSSRKVKIEVEVKNLSELKEALEAGVDRILLDNMDIATLKEAVRLTGRRVPLEASGNITLENVQEVAATGVNFISVGALTHSVKAFDVSLLIENSEG